jgi:hypothetical protein
VESVPDKDGGGSNDEEGTDNGPEVDCSGEATEGLELSVAGWATDGQAG